MKRTFYIASAFAAIMAVGCNKSEQPAGTPEAPEKPVEESGIVLYAQDINAIGSKTTTEEADGKFIVNWAEGDQLAVYTVAAGTDPTTMTLDDWRNSEPVRFKTTESAAQDGLMKFSLNETDSEAGRLTAFKERYEAGNLDWYAVYPGIMETASHAGKGMVTFGISNKSQTGNNNMDHLAKQDVLFGKVMDTKEPVIEMQHIGTLMEFAVTNSNEDEFTVKSITITAPDVIVGQFRLNLTKDEPLDKTDGFEQSGTYTLTVNDAEPIKAGENAKFYQILTPFTVASGKQVSITVTTDNGGWSKTMTASSPINFIAGTKNTANLDVKFAKDVELTEHTNITIEFGNNIGGGGNLFMNLTDASLLRWGNTATDVTEQEKIDIAAFCGSSGTVPALAAPDYEYMPYAAVKGWTVKNSTKLCIINGIDYENVAKLSEIIASYNLTATARVDITANDVIAAKLANDNYALIQVVAINKNDEGKPINAVLNVKTVE